MILHRSSGLLAHITSLPSDFGIGDIGRSALEFVDFLSDAGQTLWQILPIVPSGEGHSPYKSSSTFAGNPLLLCPHALEEKGLISRPMRQSVEAGIGDRIDFARVARGKNLLHRKAYDTFLGDADHVERRHFETFCLEQGSWLDDYALYEVLSSGHDGRSWMEWEPQLVDRDPNALERVRDDHAFEFHFVQFEQYLFQTQWLALKSYAIERGVRILGDLPIYVARESADVWANQGLFRLDERGYPTVVAGVPPDYFSRTGQYWGNPIYDWDAMKEAGYDWWIRRLRRLLEQVDLVRIDHFRGLESFWEIPATAETAAEGRWAEGPGEDFLTALQHALGTLPVIAEDLGIITERVTELRRKFELPGMAVLQFALMGGESDDLLPDRLGLDRIAYTGTHDNDTFLGWWEGLNRLAAGEGTHQEADVSQAERESAQHLLAFATRYLGLQNAPREELPWKGIEALMNSSAGAVIVPVQDLLSLGTEGRMNTPGTESGNWGWRWSGGDLHPGIARRLRDLTERSGRLAG